MKLVQRILLGLVFTSFALIKTLAAAPDDLLASYHFIGATALVRNTNAARLQAIAALPETVKLRDDVFQKLARVSVKFFGGNSANANQTALLRPLFDDLMAAESLAELRGAKPQTTFFLAARLNETRSRLWENNLQQLVKTTKPQPLKIDDANGWQAKAGAHVLQFLRAEKWTVIVLGAEQKPSDFLKQLEKQTTVSSEKNWLEATVDGPRLKGFLPLEKIPLKLARVELQVSAKSENLRTTARIIYPEKINWKSEGWQIPKELIRDPLISFSAAQKVAPFFQKPIFPEQIVSSPLTNQIFFWSQSQMPFQSYFALPVKDATNTMKALGPQLMSAFNDDLKRRDGGKLNMASNHVDLIWQGLPIIAPFVHPTKEKSGGDYLLGGLFPMAPSTNQAPAELFAQVANHNDLVFYDWEITQARLAQWSMVGQLLPIFSKEPIVSTNTALNHRLGPARMPELKWIAAVGPKLGNTITEVTYKSPTELNVVRKSHIGFSSLELILLSHWLAHPNFPFVNPFATPTTAAQHSAPLPTAPSPKP
jgi:hypothetical protein